MALDKEIFPPSEATEVAQAGFDYVNGILPFSTMFPIQSNDGEWTVSWTPNLPTLSTNAMQRRALDAEIGHTSMVEQSAEQHTGLLPLSGMDHITERDMTKHANDKQFIHDKAEAKTTHLGQTAGVTLELESISAMMDGKITINENGANVVYSFGVRPSSIIRLRPLSGPRLLPTRLPTFRVGLRSCTRTRAVHRTPRSPRRRSSTHCASTNSSVRKRPAWTWLIPSHD